MKAPTYEQIKPYIENGLVSENIHPKDENVRIFNYTKECQFSKKWDDVTVACRGLILNIATGQVLARPFPKFFNYEEHVANKWPIPAEPFTAHEKLDGSLGILYELAGEYYIATRGSFVSEQAIWATKWWRENVVNTLITNYISPGVTHLFEIIYPENRIVVNYEYSGLVHLASIENETGKTLNATWDEPLRSPKNCKAESVPMLLDSSEHKNAEGYVLHFEKSNVRIKVKFPEYVRLHRIVTGVSEIAIWEYLRDGKDLEEFTKSVPEEFLNWVLNTSKKLKDKYQEVYQEATSFMHETLDSGEYIRPDTGELDRKAVALAFQKYKHPSILFALIDGKDVAKIIWRMVRPRGSKVFTSDIDA